MKLKLLSKTLRKAAVCLVTTAILTTAAQSATVHYDPFNYRVIAIEGLEIGGNTYNVDFEAIDQGNGKYSTFGGNTTYWTTLIEVIGAGTAINDVLNNEPGTPLLQIPGQIANSFIDSYMIHIDPGASELFTNVTEPLNPNWIHAGSAPEFPGVLTAWSLAGAGTIPVPAAIWLFGSGLGLLGWMRRKTT